MHVHSTPVGVWLSPVERCVRDAEAGGSNPLTPTRNALQGTTRAQGWRNPSKNPGMTVASLRSRYRRQPPRLSNSIAKRILFTCGRCQASELFVFIIHTSRRNQRPFGLMRPQGKDTAGMPRPRDHRHPKPKSRQRPPPSFPPSLVTIAKIALKLYCYIFYSNITEIRASIKKYFSGGLGGL